MREQWGCDGPTSREQGGFEFELGETRLNRCPNALIRHRWTQAALTLFTAFENGALAKPGGVNQQTSHYNNTMHLLTTHKAQALTWYQETLNGSNSDNDG